MFFSPYKKHWLLVKMSLAYWFFALNHLGPKSKLLLWPATNRAPRLSVPWDRLHQQGMSDLSVSRREFLQAGPPSNTSHFFLGQSQLLPCAHPYGEPLPHMFLALFWLEGHCMLLSLLLLGSDLTICNAVSFPILVYLFWAEP